MPAFPLGYRKPYQIFTFYQRAANKDKTHPLKAACQEKRLPRTPID